jgi:hypothetical protein
MAPALFALVIFQIGLSHLCLGQPELWSSYLHLPCSRIAVACYPAQPLLVKMGCPGLAEWLKW